VKHCHRDSVTARVKHQLLPAVRSTTCHHQFLSHLVGGHLWRFCGVWSERIAEETKVRALTAYFIMVAVDEIGKPAEVPPLILSSDKEKALWEKGKKRYQACKAKSCQRTPTTRCAEREGLVTSTGKRAEGV